MSNIRPYGPGKFSTVPDAAVFNLAQEGTDEELAADGFGWAGLIRLSSGETLFQPELFGSVELNDDEKDFLRHQTAGCILRESSDGFVDVNYFTHPDELTEAWKGVEEDYEVFAADDSSMNP